MALPRMSSNRAFLVGFVFLLSSLPAAAEVPSLSIPWQLRASLDGRAHPGAGLEQALASSSLPKALEGLYTVAQLRTINLELTRETVYRAMVAFKRPHLPGFERYFAATLQVNEVARALRDEICRGQAKSLCAERVQEAFNAQLSAIDRMNSLELAKYSSQMLVTRAGADVIAAPIVGLLRGLIAIASVLLLSSLLWIFLPRARSRAPVSRIRRMRPVASSRGRGRALRRRALPQRKRAARA
jgi:hypothetical protein